MSFASAPALGYFWSRMNGAFDVVVAGGAFAGAATALILRRENPSLSVAIIERTTAFDRKVGEATTEVSGHFLTKRLMLTHHLNNFHIQKQGLRFWFASSPSDALEDCGELGPKFNVRLPSYQVDRAVLDQKILDEAVAAGATLIRPAKVVDVVPGQSVTVDEGSGCRRTMGARWFVDASGRAAMMGRKLDTLQTLNEHPTCSVWGRFRNVLSLDGSEIRSRSKEYSERCQTSRDAATNHLTGLGWWCWIIPLRGGDLSAGIVYDERLFTLPPGPSLSARLLAHLRSVPVGRELFQNAEPIEGDSRAYSHLAYTCSQIAGPGWQAVGDAAAFLDPLYSSGLDFASWTIESAVDRIQTEAAGRKLDLDDINRRFRASISAWFNALYKDKYYYLGDATLMRAAYKLDLAMFFLGPVRAACANRAEERGRFPFDGPVDGAIGKFMAFYNKRLSAIARRKISSGTYARGNSGTHRLIPGFSPAPGVLRVGLQGAALWLREELSHRLRPKAAYTPAHGTPIPAH